MGVSHHGLWGTDWDHRGDRRVKTDSPPSPYPRGLSPGGLGAAVLWSGSSPVVKAGGRWLRPTGLDPTLLGACRERCRRGEGAG